MSVLDRVIRDSIGRTGANILCIDIETRPLVVYSWGLFDQHHSLNQIVDEGGTMCFAGKWYGDRTVTFRADWDVGHDEMIAEAWRMLDQADIVVGYNHRNFDIKHLHREFIKAGWGPPSPHKDIDLLQVARRRFKFPSNKLDWVARELDIGRKIDLCGQELWTGCINGDLACQKTMEEYNRHDVVLTEELYDRLRGWIPNHPNLNMYRAERVSGCDQCGGTELEEAGFHYTPTRAYKQWRCSSCGGYSRATHHEPERAQHRRGAT